VANAETGRTPPFVGSVLPAKRRNRCHAVFRGRDAPALVRHDRLGKTAGNDITINNELCSTRLPPVFAMVYVNGYAIETCFYRVRDAVVRCTSPLLLRGDSIAWTPPLFSLLLKNIVRCGDGCGLFARALCAVLLFWTYRGGRTRILRVIRWVLYSATDLSLDISSADTASARQCGQRQGWCYLPPARLLRRYRHSRSSEPFMDMARRQPDIEWFLPTRYIPGTINGWRML